jgi:hypothetical protein
VHLQLLRVATSAPEHTVRQFIFSYPSQLGAETCLHTTAGLLLHSLDISQQTEMPRFEYTLMRDAVLEDERMMNWLVLSSVLLAVFVQLCDCGLCS